MNNPKLKPATARARELLFKLESLAERPGTPDEGKAAAKKIARLKRKYDFDAKAPCEQADATKEDIFKGNFQPAKEASQIYAFANDFTVSNSVKWAIEQTTRIECIYRDGKLLAMASPSAAAKLANIAVTISESFRGLWAEFEKCSGVSPADQGVFIMGLYDGMMGEARPAMLPSRTAKVVKIKRGKKSVAPAPAVALHPYSIAFGFGKQIRFSAPWNLVAKELDPFKPKEISVK